MSHQLNLPETFAARYGENKPLEEKRVEELLRRSVQVRRLPGTDLIEIRVYSRTPAERAQGQPALQLIQCGNGRNPNAFGSTPALTATLGSIASRHRAA